MRLSNKANQGRREDGIHVMWTIKGDFTKHTQT